MRLIQCFVKDIEYFHKGKGLLLKYYIAICRTQLEFRLNSLGNRADFPCTIDVFTDYHHHHQSLVTRLLVWGNVCSVLATRDKLSSHQTGLTEAQSY